MVTAKLDACKNVAQAIDNDFSTLSQRGRCSPPEGARYRCDILGKYVEGLIQDILINTERRHVDAIDVQPLMQKGLVHAGHDTYKVILEHQFIPKDALNNEGMPISEKDLANFENCCAWKAADLTLEWLTRIKASVGAGIGPI